MDEPIIDKEIHYESHGDFLAELETKRELSHKLIDEAESFIIVAVTADGDCEGLGAAGGSVEHLQIMFAALREIVKVAKEAIEGKYREQ